MGGTGKHQSKLSPPTLEVKTKQVRLSSVFPLPLLLCPLLFHFPACLQTLKLSKYVDTCLPFLHQSYYAIQKEEEGVHNNGRNGRHQERTHA
ncbi:unnamed protein product [Triticum turgidum subsp. durum]|uniref:Uncharacterized protein n=1 Tax=Triticum turgidum subsp. durum TaxID=4567 RepID=A0A9R0WFM2_TRITD|nr:unnamed protein product [Triticum turgidum subsp. durum]